MLELSNGSLAGGTFKVYGLPKGQGLDRRVDMAGAIGEGHINPAVQALARGQAINLDSALSLGFLLLIVY